MKAPMVPRVSRSGYPFLDAPSRISSLDQKPASGKIPARAKEPMTKVVNVVGMYFFRPPISLMLLECTAWITDPEPRNSSALKKAWVKRWKIAATGPPTPSPKNI